MILITPIAYSKRISCGHDSRDEGITPHLLSLIYLVVISCLCSRGPLAVCGHILRHEGPRGLYHGFLSNVMRNTPGEMVFFATYEQMRWLLKRPGQIKDDIGESFI